MELFSFISVLLWLARTGVKRKPNGIVVGKPKGKRPVGRPRIRFENNVTDYDEVL
jgi:hypothetical protein